MVVDRFLIIIIVTSLLMERGGRKSYKTVARLGRHSYLEFEGAHMERKLKKCNEVLKLVTFTYI